MSGLEVNEAVIWATSKGAEWWNEWRLHQERTGRITVITPSLGGDRVRVACDSKDDAIWLRDHMISFTGIPKTAVKVITERRSAAWRAERLADLSDDTVDPHRRGGA